MHTNTFWEFLSPETKYQFVRALLAHVDELSAQLYDAELTPHRFADLVRHLPTTERVELNNFSAGTFGSAFEKDWESVFDEVFKHFGLGQFKEGPEVDEDDDLKNIFADVDWTAPLDVGIDWGSHFDIETVDMTGVTTEEQAQRIAAGMSDLKEIMETPPGLAVPEVPFEWPAVFSTVRKPSPMLPDWGDASSSNPVLHDYEENPNGLPRLMIMGHGRHGKDTVCELLEEMYGFRWVSSSWKCAEKVIGSILQDDNVAKEFLDSLQEDKRAEMIQQRQTYWDEWNRYYSTTRVSGPPMGFVDWLFESRASYRELWYLGIKWYNMEDPTKLCREIMSEADVYCGIRDARELTAIKNSGLLDTVIWVDASRRLPPEDASSISIQPWHADVHLDNNGTLPQLRTAVMQLMWGEHGLEPKE